MFTKIQIFGVVCELNPLHNGHAWLWKQLRERGANRIVAVMSGNYVQRGQPALFDKWVRTRAALAAGADLVLELPLPWAISGAERFAFGGVSLLHRLGCVQTLGFGSECGDAELLFQLAKALESPSFPAALEEARQKDPGKTFAAQYQRAAASLVGEEAAALLNTPNDSLAVCYLRAMQRLHSSMDFSVVQRVGAGYHEREIKREQPFPSATQVRVLMETNPQCDLTPYMTTQCAGILSEAIESGTGPVYPHALEQAVLAKLRTMTVEELSQLPELSEGLEQRLYQAVRRASSLEELYALVKTKRYTHGRIRRLILSAFLGVNESDSLGEVPYCRVLGMTREGRELLPFLQKQATLPLVLRHRDTERLDEVGRCLYDLTCRSTDLYSLGCPRIQPCGREMTQGVIVVP